MSIERKVSVIIPTYNEEKTIVNCLNSLLDQANISIEIIVVDDGSTDRTVSIVKQFIVTKNNKLIRIYPRKHSGPGSARNFGSKKAKGRVLVFVDADMTFEKNFIEFLARPIFEGKTLVTNSKEEYIANSQNYWAKSWNIGRFFSAKVFSDRYKYDMVPNPRNFGTIYRAIDTKLFHKVGGFDSSGDYQDDESLFRKIGVRAKIVDAKFFHSNPSSLKEVWERAKWIGSSKSFLTGHSKITLIANYFPVASFIKGIFIGTRFDYPQFVLFKIVYDLSILQSALKNI